MYQHGEIDKKTYIRCKLSQFIVFKDLKMLERLSCELKNN